MPKPLAIPQNVTLYPTQRAIVEAFAQRTNRKFSNAVQFIIDDWARLVDPDNTLTRQAVRPATARRRKTTPRPSLSEIPTLTKGLTVKPN